MPSREPRLPLWLKVAYTAFVVVLVPIYWVNYGPANFLYFCDLALLVTLAAIWLESPLLASMPTVGILAPQALWVADLFANMLGHPIVGMTDYMFDQSLPLHLRALSLFHGWLPFLLLFLVWRLGYDARAFVTGQRWRSASFSSVISSCRRRTRMPAPPPSTSITSTA